MILKRRILLKRRKVDNIMNEDYIYSGKTVEDAITNACVSLGVTSDQITYEVTDKGSKGLFSLGTKEAEIQEQSCPRARCVLPTLHSSRRCLRLLA